ncbi:hypothetical protein KBP53_10875 [Corynebacterium genitalium ATCC 33030]|uniref:HMA domain-containing protein n=1 Tax=Corynebacterium genitalium ATCC 33030 TaxID=585529 RepID=D7W9B7_9CORY|nr:MULTISPECIES: hypothetical protein [Corynebacterium]EFK55397.1 hypothetical protein HMPREF0291_10655 [Corynebacterium genitalium ATCC 33030]MCQ4620131.1 hypothetical protein [Corynebacterium sp. CCUG 71335]MCQ4623094.1 hypothetical protein [Corynebacterium sp. CCUG 70398]MCQ4624283.1 hypothetical protein [Corynebacterium sp. CCUG 69979]MCQ4626820.1 hypothetical protein [Corynebacterium sp. CCUG 65737]
MTKNYRFEGPTDTNSVDTLQAEVSQVLGTQGVDINAETKVMRVTGEGFTDEQIEYAVEYAGFSLIDA